MIDLDEAPTATRRGVEVPWVVASVAIVAAAVLGGMLIPRPAEPKSGTRPIIRVVAESLPGTVGADPAAFIPTITASYADGTRGEAFQALEEPWRPDRPIRMLTVAAGVSCTIIVDWRVAVIEHAPINRVAVCVWVAPP